MGVVDFSKEKLKYPCKWFGRIVTDNLDGIHSKLEEELKNAGYGNITVVFVKYSAGEKYCSFSVEYELQKDGELEQILSAINCVPGVKVVV